jgi:hypothetical protein
VTNCVTIRLTAGRFGDDDDTTVARCDAPSHFVIDPTNTGAVKVPSGSQSDGQASDRVGEPANALPQHDPPDESLLYRTPVRTRLLVMPDQKQGRSQTSAAVRELARYELDR